MIYMGQLNGDVLALCRAGLRRGLMGLQPQVHRKNRPFDYNVLLTIISDSFINQLFYFKIAFIKWVKSIQFRLGLRERFKIVQCQ